MAKEGVGWIEEWTPAFPSKVGQRTWRLVGSKSPAGRPGWGSCGLLAGLCGGFGRITLIKLHMSVASRGHIAWWPGGWHLGYTMTDKPLEAPVDGRGHSP